MFKRYQLPDSSEAQVSTAQSASNHIHHITMPRGPRLRSRSSRQEFAALYHWQLSLTHSSYHEIHSYVLGQFPKLTAENGVKTEY
jgi:hypothetical protein